jgi:hypothetical protein
MSGAARLTGVRILGPAVPANAFVGHRPTYDDIIGRQGSVGTAVPAFAFVGQRPTYDHLSETFWLRDYSERVNELMT